jgi:hypothetical protein
MRTILDIGAVILLLQGFAPLLQKAAGGPGIAGREALLPPADEPGLSLLCPRVDDSAGLWLSQLSWADLQRT